MKEISLDSIPERIVSWQTEVEKRDCHAIITWLIHNENEDGGSRCVEGFR